MSEQEERARVVAVAHEWVGTPYHDMGELKGIGTDCAKLIKCVFLEAGLIPPIQIPNYSRQWFLHNSQELYMNRVLKLAHEISESEVQPGDIVLYKIGHCFAHGAIIINPGWPAIIHAWYKMKKVMIGNGVEGELGRAKRVRKFFTRW